MKNRRVRFTATAQEHVRREKAWWLANRDHPDVFTEELEQALQIIAVLPGAGTLYAQSPVPGVRRLYLRRVAVHLYYTFDDARLIVRALWGARRERGRRIYQITLHGSPSSQSDSSALHAHYHVRCLPLEIGINPASSLRVHHLDEVHQVPFGIDE